MLISPPGATASLPSAALTTAVILGGAMNFGGHEDAVGRRFIEQVRGIVRKRAFPIPAQKTVIDFAALGSDAGYIGAAGIARVEHHRKA